MSNHTVWTSVGHAAHPNDEFLDSSAEAPGEERERRPVHKPWIAAQKNLMLSHISAAELPPTYLPAHSLLHPFPVTHYLVLVYFFVILFVILNTF